MKALTLNCRAQRSNFRASSIRWPGVYKATTCSNSGSKVTRDPVFIMFPNMLMFASHSSSSGRTLSVQPATSAGRSYSPFRHAGRQRVLAFGLALAFVGAGLAAVAAPAPKPNIVVMLSDDMGFSDLGCYGSEIHTPNLDHLAAEGLRFTQFYNTARCCPTRASLLTGLYPHQAGVGHMIEDRGLEGYQGELNTNCVTIAEVLKPAGYRTYAVGKWHVAHNTQPDGAKYDWPLQRGFDHYYGTIHGAGSYWDPSSLVHDNQMLTAVTDPDYHPAKFYYTDAISDHAVRFIANHARDHGREPFFMYVAYTAAHWPLHAKEADIARYHGVYKDGYEPVRKARFAREKELGLIDPQWELSPQAGDWDTVTNKAWEARCMEVYAAQVDCMDQGIGRIVAALKQTGQLDNTLLLFLQDNGGCAEPTGRSGAKARADHPSLPPLAPDFLQQGSQPKQTRDGWPVLTGPLVMPGPADTFIAYGRSWANVSDTPFREYKHWVHEGGIATPLIVHWPAVVHASGALRRQPGHLVDIMATCLDVAGAHYPAEFKGARIPPPEGKSLRPAFEDQPIVREALFWEHEGNRAVRVGDWKLVAKGPAGQWELYNMAADRTELHDLAADQPARVRELAAQWEAYARRAKVLPWIWKPQYGQTTNHSAPAATRFLLKPDTNLEGDDRPDLIKHGFTLTVEVAKPGRNGVLVAQGGGTRGWSLVFKEGTLAFCLRKDKRLETVTAQAPALATAKTIRLVFGRDGAVKLFAGDLEVGAGKTSGPLGLEPGEGLQVGRDLGVAVGDYASPFSFDGDIASAVLVLE